MYNVTLEWTLFSKKLSSAMRKKSEVAKLNQAKLGFWSILLIIVKEQKLTNLCSKSVSKTNRRANQHKSLCQTVSETMFYLILSRNACMKNS